MSTYNSCFYENSPKMPSKLSYGDDSKFSDRHALANTVDPDQTAPRGAV